MLPCFGANRLARVMPGALLALTLICSATLQSQTFVKITDAANPIVTNEPGTNGYVGASWIDFNNDGRLDLFANRLFLYRNDGGAFTKIASGIGANQIQTIGSGNSWADYDNDGDIDCFYSGRTSRLYRNNGNETFTPITSGSIGDSVAARGWSCAWADYDNDGNLDLFITHPAGFVGQDLPAVPNHLFHNDGPPNYTFTRVTAGELVTVLAPFTVATWSDYDNDGDMDLFIGSGPASPVLAVDYLYRNMLKESGTTNFARITTAPIATDLVDGQVWNWIDYDNDGDLDAYLTNYGGSLSPPGLANNLYRNNNGTFVRMTNAQVGSLVSDRGVSLASVWGDFDNDGDLDALITQETGFQRRYYRNNGDGTFSSTGTGDFVAGTDQHSSASAGDYDNDGDLDIYVTGTGATKALFRNDLTSGNSWSNILCTGTVSNRSAIGAKVRAKATINGKAVWQLREISSQNTFNGQSMLNAHFGFGNAALIDSLKIEWPSGHVEVARNVPVNRFITITEGSGIPTGVAENGAALPADFALSQNYPNPLQTSAINSVTTITYNLPKSSQVFLGVYNVLGQKIVTLVNRAQEAGSHTATWNGKDAKGEPLPSGIYLYKIEAESFVQTKKLILTK